MQLIRHKILHIWFAPCFFLVSIAGCGVGDLRYRLELPDLEISPKNLTVIALSTDSGDAEAALQELSFTLTNQGSSVTTLLSSESELSLKEKEKVHGLQIAPKETKTLTFVVGRRAMREYESGFYGIHLKLRNGVGEVISKTVHIQIVRDHSDDSDDSDDNGDSDSHFGDRCSNYFSGDVRKPRKFPDYTSMLQEPWTFRRDLANLEPQTTFVVKPDPTSPNEFSSLVDAFNYVSAEGVFGATILVEAFSGAEKAMAWPGIVLENGDFPAGDGALHIYFTTPNTILGPPSFGGGDIFWIHHTKNLVIDGMNNLKLLGSTSEKPQDPRALIFVGGFQSEPGFDRAENIVVKNIELDGGYYKPDDLGSKWGYKGSATTNVSICNLNVHNTRQEHGFYQGKTDGHFEVVASKIDTVGRTCIQHRSDAEYMPDAVVVYADNICSNSCDGSALTVHDPTGKAFVHGNTVINSVGGFASMDSAKGDHNHKGARVYIYNNRFLLNELPEQHPDNGGFSAYCSGKRSTFTFDGTGARFYLRRNHVQMLGGPAKTIYSLKQPYVWSNGSKSYYSFLPKIAVAQSNRFHFGDQYYYQNSTDEIGMAYWQYLDADGALRETSLSIADWKIADTNLGKRAYDTSSSYRFVGDD